MLKKQIEWMFFRIGLKSVESQGPACLLPDCPFFSKRNILMLTRKREIFQVVIF